MTLFSLVLGLFLNYGDKISTFVDHGMVRMSSPVVHQNQKSTYYCGGNVFGIICDATKYMEEACLQYGYKHYRGNIIEGVKE